jgi:putative phage-type endonuclease
MTEEAKKTETGVEELCVFLFCEHYHAHVGDLHHVWFEPDMVDNVRELATATLESPLDEAVLNQALDLFNLMYPTRTSRCVLPGPTGNFEATLERLRAQPKNAQRTPEWYEARHNLITASSAHKMFGTQSEQNSLIVEKCAPEKERPPLSLHDARHWGVRYEPVSTMYYSVTRDTEVEEFGCLVHPVYRFLGASPDGINVKVGSEVYGRMLEIKNPVSRVITGEPIPDYWIQMQMQMEVCDIDACDFLETRFVEYDTYESFYADGTFAASADGKPKGVILLFSKEGKFVYEYAPYGALEEAVTPWEVSEKEREGREFVQALYWRLEEVSCVLVLRNKGWFNAHQESMVLFWETVCQERSSNEWTKRLPAKKTPTWD